MEGGAASRTTGECEEEDIRDGLCAVCLQVLLHPVELDCGHVFCFLCVKGVTLQGLHRAAVAAQARPNAQQPQPPRGSGASCPMCRAPIQPHTLLNPNLIDTPTSASTTTQDAVAADPNGQTHDHHSQDDSKGHSSCPVFSHWFYEGRNGWWQYDTRTEVELEKAYQLFIQHQQETLVSENVIQNPSSSSDDQQTDPGGTSADNQQGQSDEGNQFKTTELLIAGFIYTIDFVQMVQYRSSQPHKRRKVKRDVVNNLEGQLKGVAGIRNHTVPSETSTPPSANPPPSDEAVDDLATNLARSANIGDEDTTF